MGDLVKFSLEFVEWWNSRKSKQKKETKKDELAAQLNLFSTFFFFIVFQQKGLANLSEIEAPSNGRCSYLERTLNV